MTNDDQPTDDAAPETAEGAAAPTQRVWTEAEVKAQLDAATEEAKERVLRVAAEYENYRRRVQREKEQWTSDAIERFALDLLGVLDDFDRALALGTESSPVLEGVRLTDKQLRAVLARHGVEAIDPAGQKFDPKLHEAIQRVPPNETSPPGAVVLVFEKGYVLKGKLLRPARVAVAGDA